MQLSEQLEEILEAMWIAREEKNNDYLKLSWLRDMPDTHMLEELINLKIVERCKEDGIRLTDRGLGLAGDAVRRHRLAERLLTDVLRVRKDMIHETACQFEHHLHRGIDQNVCTLLGHPKTCPHGRPIPPGKCCMKGAKVVPQAVSALSVLKPGQAGKVAYLSTTEPARAQMLLSMGIVPGTKIELLSGFPSFLFQLNESQFAVDKDVAREIYVRIETD